MIVVIPCTCGLIMRLCSGYYVCDSCDRLQPQELAGKPRKTTAYDRRFAMAWQSAVREFYPRTFDKNGKDLAA